MTSPRGIAATGRPDSALRRAAVLGRPVAHSLSPVLHNAAYAALNLPWHYEARDCGAGEFEALLAGAGPEWGGFSVTMPLKRLALAAATEVDERAAAVGAANTLLPLTDGSGASACVRVDVDVDVDVDDRAGAGAGSTVGAGAEPLTWRAANTDVDGILGALAEHSVQPDTVTVLGAGGTAQAVVVALSELRVKRCTVLLRDATRASEVLDTAARVGVQVRLRNFSDAGTLSANLSADLVVSTLPAGVADVFSGHPWASGQAVLDVVYDPWPSQLCRAAQELGATAVSGALMLLHQAARQVELMTGCPAPEQQMRAALRTAAPDAGL